MVTERLCRFWNDMKDIQSAVLQKLPEWVQRQDLVGWIRADEAPSADVMNELARLPQENRELRSKLSAQSESFDGLTFDEVVQLLCQEFLL
jgi:O-phosphoseryl-tRNA(Cys) synthetase